MFTLNMAESFSCVALYVAAEGMSGGWLHYMYDIACGDFYPLTAGDGVSVGGKQNVASRDTATIVQQEG